MSDDVVVFFMLFIGMNKVLFLVVLVYDGLVSIVESDRGDIFDDGEKKEEEK